VKRVTNRIGGREMYRMSVVMRVWSLMLIVWAAVAAVQGRDSAMFFAVLAVYSRLVSIDVGRRKE
jgi:hypothetical protein